MTWNPPSQAMPRRRARGLAARVAGLSLAAAALAPLACNTSYDPPPTSAGEFGLGTFTYRCAGDSDALCPNNVYATAFPKAIAVGGRFSLDYEYNKDNDDQPLPGLQSGAPERVSQSAGVFTALLPGYTAILAVGGNSEVIDVKHMLVSPIDHLAVTVDGLATTGVIELEAGQSVTLIAAPQDANDVALGGSLDYTWTIGDPGVAEWLSSADDETITLAALSAGSTTITVQAEETTRMIELTVTPGGSTSSSTGESTTTDGTTTDATTTDASTTDASTTDATTTDATTGG